MHAELKVGDLLLYVSDSPWSVACGDQVSLMIQCDGGAQVDTVLQKM